VALLKIYFFYSQFCEQTKYSGEEIAEIAREQFAEIAREQFPFIQTLRCELWLKNLSVGERFSTKPICTYFVHIVTLLCIWTS